MTQFEDHEEITILEAEDIGENFIRVTRTVGKQDDGDGFEFVSYKKGYINDDGDEVYTDSQSLGSPQHLNDVIEALEELRDEIYDN